MFGFMPAFDGGSFPPPTGLTAKTFGYPAESIPLPFAPKIAPGLSLT